MFRILESFIFSPCVTDLLKVTISKIGKTFPTSEYSTMFDWGCYTVLIFQAVLLARQHLLRVHPHLSTGANVLTSTGNIVNNSEQLLSPVIMPSMQKAVSDPITVLEVTVGVKFQISSIVLWWHGTKVSILRYSLSVVLLLWLMCYCKIVRTLGSVFDGAGYPDFQKEHLVSRI